MRWIFDQLFGKALDGQTTRYLETVMRSSIRASRQNATELLKTLASSQGPQITFGEASWGEPVRIPVNDIITSHGMMTGGTGSGKTVEGLVILDALLDLIPHTPSLGVGLVDPKRDFFMGALLLLARRLSTLDAKTSEALRRRVVIYDFSSRDPLSAYNILARSATVEPDFFAASRADLLLDLLPGNDTLSLGASALLRRAILLLSEVGMPITSLDDLLYDEAYRARLLANSKNEELRAYFARQFASVPKQTVAALARRVDALFSVESVRLALSGTTAPDFKSLQDEGKIVLINCFGESISRGVRQLLQSLVLSDLSQAVFARQRRETRFLWVCDEAQTFFLTQHLRERMNDLLTMARSFGSSFLFLTQNIGTAVQDARALSNLHTNTKWSLSLRGQPSDCAFLKSALPVTGRRLKPQTNPFQEPEFYSLNEERSLELDSIAHLPDRTGYLWLKSRSSEAIKMTTQELSLRHGQELESAIESLRKDPAFGARLSREDYELAMAKRELRWHSDPKGDLGSTLAGAYQRTRGERI